MGGTSSRSSSSAGPSAPNTARRIAPRVIRSHRLQRFELAALRPGRDLAHHLVFDDVLVASHPLAVKRRAPPICGARRSSSPARLNVDPGPNTSPRNRPRCRAFDQIGARAEHVLNQDWVADHHRMAQDRQIHADTRCRTVGPERQTFAWFEAKNATPWTGFGIRGLAVAVPTRLSPLPCIPPFLLRKTAWRHPDSIGL